MKRYTKTLLALLSCVAVTASVAGLSACSLLFPVIGGDDGADTDDDTPGGSDGATYTLDVAAYDPYWYDSVVDSSLWRTTGTVGAYAKDTLVLNADGTYELTKEMGADEVSDARWSSDGGVNDRNFNKYTYYGTYEKAADGVTVTLSACTRIAVEVDVYDMTVEYQLGSNPIDYIETDDLTLDAGTCGDELVVDFIVGFYIADEGYGNSAQTVTLGTYDYGTFTFNGATGGEPEEPEEPEEPDTRPSYAFTAATNDEITFNIYADGTYTFAWAANKVSESGTYTWDRITQTLVITDPAGTETDVIAKDGTLSFTYNFSQNAQLNQAYTGSVEEMEDVICEVIYSLIPVTDGSITLDLYADGTFTYTDAKNLVRDTAYYDWDGINGTLTLNSPAGQEFVSTSEGNLLYITYASGASSQKCVGSLAAMHEAIPSVKLIYSFEPQKNELYTLGLYSDGTYVFNDGQHGITESGVWTLSCGVLTFTDPLGQKTSVTAEGNEFSFTYNYSATSQLNQPYKGKASELAAAMYEYDMSEEVYSFQPQINELYTLTLYANGMYRFFDGQHSVTEFGAWTFADGAFTVTDPLGQQTVATISGDEISFTYNYSVTSALNQPYKGSVSALMSAMSEIGAVKSIYSFVAGVNQAITFELYNNGMYRFAWAAQGVSEYGVWTFADGAFAVTDPLGQKTVATISGDTISFTYNYSLTSQLNQPYTGSVSALMQAMIENGMVKEVYAFEPQKNASITFTLYNNGIYLFAWNEQGVKEFGVWSYEGGVFTVTDPKGQQTVATINGDAISFTYALSLNSALTQDYLGSVSALMDSLAENGMVKAIYSFEPQKNASITFTLYDNGMYAFAWPEQGVKEFGTWSYEDGAFAVTDPLGQQTVATISGDEISFTYNYSQTSALNQAYKGSVSALEAAVENMTGGEQ